MSTVGRRVPLPPQVGRIRKELAELAALHPHKKFTMDGHLVGSIGEVVACEALNLKHLPNSAKGIDAHDEGGAGVQIKLRAGDSIEMNGNCERLVVLQIVSDEEAEIVYDGPGAPAWGDGKVAKNGQKQVSLSTLRKLAKVQVA